MTSHKRWWLQTDRSGRIPLRRDETHRGDVESYLTIHELGSKVFTELLYENDLAFRSDVNYSLLMRGRPKDPKSWLPWKNPLVPTTIVPERVS